MKTKLKNYKYYFEGIKNKKIQNTNKSIIGMALQFKDENILKRTESENKFRNFLFKNKIHFEEQKLFFFTLPNKKIDEFYIADFYIFNKKTIIEIDGGYHLNEDQKILDKIRDNDFKKKKHIKTIRIPNNLVNNMEYLNNAILPKII